MRHSCSPAVSLPLLLMWLFASCGLTDSTEDGYRIRIESGTGTQLVTVPVVPAPPGSITCPEGRAVGREEAIGPTGGTIRIDPPVTSRRIGLHAFPQVGATSARFRIMEIPVRYPEVEATAPEGRPIRVTVSARGCEFDGQLRIFRWNGGGWNVLENLGISLDSIVSVELESASRFAVGTVD